MSLFRSLFGKAPPPPPEVPNREVMVPDASEEHSERRKRNRVNARANTRVLVIDDSATIVAALAKTLQSAGYQTIQAFDAENGIEAARQEQPELIFLDIVLPGMNGFAALRQMRRDPATRHIPIIMISGNEQATEQFYANRIGADDFMKKPFSRSEVFAKIEPLLDEDLVPRRRNFAPGEAPITHPAPRPVAAATPPTTPPAPQPVPQPAAQAAPAATVTPPAPVASVTPVAPVAPVVEAAAVPPPVPAAAAPAPVTTAPPPAIDQAPPLLTPVPAETAAAATLVAPAADHTPTAARPAIAPPTATLTIAPPAEPPAPPVAVPPVAAAAAPAAVPAPAPQPSAPGSAYSALEARKELTAMGLQYFDQAQFVAAVQRGDKLAFELFVAGGGVDINAESNGKTPLQVAREHGRTQIFALLRARIASQKAEEEAMMQQD